MYLDIAGKPADRHFEKLVDTFVLVANEKNDAQVIALIKKLDAIATKNNDTFYTAFYKMLKQNAETLRDDEACGECLVCELVAYALGKKQVHA